MYWLSALPLSGDTPENVWIALQKSTQRHDYSQNFEFRLPNTLKVGTLDSLLSLSDDLVKVNTAVEVTVNKIRRQLYELQNDMPDDTARGEITVDGHKPEKYLQSFIWDEAKYPSRRPPKDTVTAIMETVQKLDDDLKVRSTEYTQAKTSLQAVLRKSRGSLAVRDVSNIVPEELIVSTENLTTLVTIVPKNAREEWVTSYETLSDFVVPRSSAIVTEDSDYVAFSVVVFRRIVDDFKASARAKGFQAKDVAGTEFGGEEDPAEDVGIAHTRTDEEATLQKIRNEVEKKRESLNRWCSVSYAEAFSSWIHVTAIRLFVESILRYGLPPQFLPVLIKPNTKYESQLRKILSSNFAAIGGEHFTEGGAGGHAGGEELFPFVSFTLSIEE